jgi:hypothetical protein
MKCSRSALKHFGFWFVVYRGVCYSDLCVGDRRHQLAQLGSSTGVLRTIVKWLVGVPQVLMHQSRLALCSLMFLEWQIHAGR